MKVAILTIFNSDYFGHGGEKRTAQLEFLLKKKSKKIDRIKLPFVASNSTIYKRSFFINLILPFIKPFLFLANKHSLFFHIQDPVRGYLKEELIKNISLIKNADIIIWENSFPQYYFVVDFIKKNSEAKIIACPHNLESLIDQEHINWYGISKPQRQKLEFSALRNCDLIFTISEEENWLLNQYHLNSYYLPYSAEDEFYKSLINIRKIRSARQIAKKNFLILGSATNTPTKKGMESVLNYLNSEDALNQINFIIAGYGSEIFKSFEKSNINCLGEISNEKMFNLFETIDAVIINQGFSTGALTKISDFLIAGIPVISDTGSSRSFNRFDGIFNYNNFIELKQILNSFNSTVSELPDSPKTAYLNFLNLIFEQNIPSTNYELSEN